MAIFRRRPKPRRLRDLSELDELLDDPRPVLLDFYQVGCAPCQVMDGIMNELAAEFGDGAHIVKVDVGRVPGAIEAFRIRSTPTLVLLARPRAEDGKRVRRRGASRPNAAKDRRRKTQRWRASGLVKKDQLERLLLANGARRPDAQS